jgi:hypothetical protein
MAARGFTGKGIAYGLGVSSAFSSEALGRAAAKVGLGARVQLVEVAALLFGARRTASISARSRRRNGQCSTCFSKACRTPRSRACASARCAPSPTRSRRSSARPTRLPAIGRRPRASEAAEVERHAVGAAPEDVAVSVVREPARRRRPHDGLHRGFTPPPSRSRHAHSLEGPFLSSGSFIGCPVLRRRPGRLLSEHSVIPLGARQVSGSCQAAIERARGVASRCRVCSDGSS